MAPKYLLLAALFLALPASGFAQEEEREAVPRGSRPQGDNPTTGTAVRRSAPRPNPAPAPPPEAGAPREPRTENRGDRGAVIRDRDDRRGDRGGTTIIVPDRRRTTVVVPRPHVYYNYPRRVYPYGYGAFGLGYFYYDPYRWGGTTWNYGYPGYNGYYGRPSSFDLGDLRLDVTPRHAQVFVDGYYAGIVDDFDGAFQALKLEAGPHRIEIAAPGYESLTFDVYIERGRDIRYRGDLRRY